MDEEFEGSNKVFRAIRAREFHTISRTFGVGVVTYPVTPSDLMILEASPYWEELL